MKKGHAGWARFRLRGKEMMRPFREYKVPSYSVQSMAK